MNMSNNINIDHLLLKAQEALKFSKSQYSDFKVGAAFLLESGEIIMGANIENKHFNLTICAERVAMVKALSEGKECFKFLALACINSLGQFSYNSFPCGSCRQFMTEYAPYLPIAIKDSPKSFKIYQLDDLLPNKD